MSAGLGEDARGGAGDEAILIVVHCDWMSVIYDDVDNNEMSARFIEGKR